MMLLAFAAAAAVLPTQADLAGALAQVRGGKPRIAQVHCASSSAGYVRCTYLEATKSGYGRWAVLVSNRDGRWTVSEGPIRERAGEVRRAN